MATVNTKTTLDTAFKYAVASKITKLMPDNTELLRSTKLEAAQKTGRKYLCPVALTFENGVTYGDDTAFTLEDAVAGVYDEIELDSAPVILRSQVAQSAANRMANDEKAFVTWAWLRSENMFKSLAKRAEIEMWYGKTGLGKVSGITAAGAGTETITLTAATWAPGIWSGMEGAKIEVRNGASGVAGHTSNTLTISSVNYTNRTLTVVGNITELGNVAATHDIYFRGAYTNGMNGVDKQMTNSGTLFGIDAATYALWRSESHSAESGALNMSKILKGVSKAVGKGGLDEMVKLYVASLTYENLNSDFGALRALDSSYSKSKGENGVERIEYVGQNGKIEVVPCSFIKEGESFILPPGAVTRVGAKDLTFDTGYGNEEFFLPLAGTAGYELRCQYDFAVLIKAPAKCVKITTIVNS